jgi:hypothetical protein
VPPRCFRDHAEIREQSDKPCRSDGRQESPSLM